MRTNDIFTATYSPGSLLGAALFAYVFGFRLS